MPLQDESPKNFAILFPDYKPARDNELDAWLRKEAQNVKQAMDTTPETSTKSDEDKNVVGMTQLYDDPGERNGDEHDARWGEEPAMDEDGHHTPANYNPATKTQANVVRQGVLDKALNSKSLADEVERELMSSNFDHVSSGQFTTHSALLQEKAKYAEEPTLSQKVKKLVGG